MAALALAGAAVRAFHFMNPPRTVWARWSRCLLLCGGGAVALALGPGLARATEPPVITAQTGDLTAYAGSPASLGVAVTGTSPLTFEWTKDGTRLPGATNATVAIATVRTNDAGVYQVTVRNAAGAAASEPMTLTVLPDVPRFLQDLEDQTALEGQAAAVGVTVAGAAPLFYLWYYNGALLTNVFGPSILFAPVALTNAGTYQVVVTNSLGAATSRVATLAVKPNTPRQLRVGALEFPDASSLRVPIEFAAQGNEQGLSFSLQFNGAALADPLAVFTDAARALLPGAVLSVVESEVAEGRLGFRVELPSGLSMPTQTFRLAEVYFQRLPGTAWAQAGLAFGHAPVPLGAVDATQTPLPVLDRVQPQLAVAPLTARPDRQSGLFLHALTLVNPGAVKMDGVEVRVHGLSRDALGRPMRLYNASGATNDVPYLHYGPLLPGQTVTLTAEYYVADRQTVPAPVYEPLLGPLRRVVASGGAVFAITTARFTNGVFILDFQTQAGRQYYIQYVEDINSQAWQTAVPAVLGTGSRVQWVDRGPPKTQSPPAGQSSRFYRGMLMP